MDEEVSGALFLEIGILEIVRQQLTRTDPPSGMRPTSEGVDLLLGLLANNLRSRGRLNFYVTHDSILAVLVASLYQLPVDEISWPGYLDGLILWRNGDRLHFIWRGLVPSQLNYEKDIVGAVCHEHPGWKSASRWRHEPYCVPLRAHGHVASGQSHPGHAVADNYG